MAADTWKRGCLSSSPIIFCLGKSFKNVLESRKECIIFLHCPVVSDPLWRPLLSWSRAPQVWSLLHWCGPKHLGTPWKPGPGIYLILIFHKIDECEMGGSINIEDFFIQWFRKSKMYLFRQLGAFAVITASWDVYCMHSNCWNWTSSKLSSNKNMMNFSLRFNF